MKHLKFLLLLAVSVCTFATTQAQINVHIGGRGRYYHGGRYWHNRAPYWRAHRRHWRYY